MKLMLGSGVRLWLFAFKASAPFYSLKAPLERESQGAEGHQQSCLFFLSLPELEMHSCH